MHPVPSAVDDRNPNLFGWQDWPPDQQQYPETAGFKAYGPSQEAARAVAPFAKTLRDRVLRLVQSLAPDEALTADQIALKLERSVLSIRPRVSELSAAGKIRPVKERGRNQSGMTATKWRSA